MLPTQRHTSTCMQAHTSLSSLCSYGATVMANLNPSLTITAVSSDWTEVVLADNILTDRRGPHGFPTAFYPPALKRAPYCTEHKGPFLSHNFSHWNISDLFKATLEEVNKKQVLTKVNTTCQTLSLTS